MKMQIRVTKSKNLEYRSSSLIPPNPLFYPRILAVPSHPTYVPGMYLYQIFSKLLLGEFKRKQYTLMYPYISPEGRMDGDFRSCSI